MPARYRRTHTRRRTMSNTIELLDRARKLCSPATDYQLAKRLDISHATISRCRHRHGTLDNKAAWKLAEMLEMEPAEVIALMEADRAKRPEDRQFWERARAGVAASLAAIIGLFVLLGSPAPAEARAEQSTLSKVRRRSRIRSWNWALSPVLRPCSP